MHPNGWRRAALELFAKYGFEQTTVPEIAERAGTTTRSFFRHFTDKREVLFRGDDAMPEKITVLLASAPASLSIMDALSWGVETIAKNFFEDHRDQLQARRGIVETDFGLKERELRKQADMASAIADALEGEGLDPLTATVAGKVAITISTTAITRWLDATDERPLIAHIREVRQSVTDLTAAPPPTKPYKKPARDLY